MTYDIIISSGAVLFGALLSSFITFLITSRKLEVSMGDKAQRISDEQIQTHCKINHQRDKDVIKSIDQIKEEIHDLNTKHNNNKIVLNQVSTTVGLIAKELKIIVPPPQVNNGD